MSNLKQPKTAEQILRELIDTVEATGGVGYDRKGHPHPRADPEWVDIANIYLDACHLLDIPAVTHRDVELENEYTGDDKEND